jgi:hypothetical protein
MAIGDIFPVIMDSEKDSVNGVPTLDNTGKIKKEQLPDLGIDTSIASHNNSPSAHNDIRILVKDAKDAAVAAQAAADKAQEQIDDINNSSQTITIDTTLKIPGAAADAKVVGEEFNSIFVLINSNSDNVNKKITDHINNKSNPHSVTAEQVGADPAGSAADALNAAKKYTDNQISAIGGLSGDVGDHVTNKNNPHSVTAEQVGADPAGSAAQALTDAKKYTLDQISTFGEHFSNKDNPHNVTAEQVGAAPVSHGTHVEFSAALPRDNGIAHIGSATTVSRSDHVHPSDYTKAPMYSYSTADITSGTTSLNTGKMHLVYE